MLHFYQRVIRKSEGFLEKLLQKRVAKGKEDPARLGERQGVASFERPEGPLLWLHAASVGEAQSALILIRALLKLYPKIHILVTTGTLTSAERMEDSLPERAFHQFVPLDHPDWVKQFLDHWRPDLVLWMESELWPSMLLDIKARGIAMVLINARLSNRSYRRWRLFRSSAYELLEAFHLVLAQTPLDAKRFKKLGARNIIVSDNIKYSASALPYDEDDLIALKTAIMNRPFCVYASTHEGEEEMVIRIQNILEASNPEMLSIIVPRHPSRGQAIFELAQAHRMQSVLRGADKALPDEDTQIYIADTMGELGLFYRLAEIVYIGRSLSKDGGGGHNPIEAAQLQCAILHGPYTQNLKEIYDDMEAHFASKRAQNEQQLAQAIHFLLEDPQARRLLVQNALNFSNAKSHVIDRVLDGLKPLIEAAGIGSS